MKRWKALAATAALLAASAAMAQEKPAPPKGFDPAECAKRCQEMAAAHQKMTEARQAAKERHEAAWKKVRADLDAAKKATGNKKVAALEDAIETLVSLHEEMASSMKDGVCPMCGMRFGAGHRMGPRAMMGHGCCDDMEPPPDCPRMPDRD